MTSSSPLPTSSKFIPIRRRKTYPEADGPHTAPSSPCGSPVLVPRPLSPEPTLLDLNPQTPSSRTVVVFGSTGAGKSSVINMLDSAPGTEKHTAQVAGYATGVTSEARAYEKVISHEHFKVFDTPGLHEGNAGKVPMEEAIVKLHDLLVDQTNHGGIHLIAFVLRGGRISKAEENNYQLIKYICGDNIPLALVFTGLENEENMAGWWTEQEEQRAGNARFPGAAGHICITSIKGRNGAFAKEYEDSKRRLDELFAKTSLSLQRGCPIRRNPSLPSAMAKITAYISLLRTEGYSGDRFHTKLALFLHKSIGIGKKRAATIAGNVALPDCFYDSVHVGGRRPRTPLRLIWQS